MDNIRVLVVDDEQPARHRILELLERQPDVEIVGVGRDGYDSVRLINDQAPDLMFLDIEMPGMSGFEVLKAASPEVQPFTIFVTGYDQYALLAFEANAIDYLLKPFSDERFEAALRRGRSQIRNRALGELGKRFTDLMDHQPPAKGSPYLERLLLRVGGRVMFLNVTDIDWIEGAGVYVNLHAGSRTHLYRGTVGQLQERLDPRQFVRVHRSTLVNTSRIMELKQRTHGDYVVILNSGVEVSLSRGHRAEFENWLGQPL